SVQVTAAAFTVLFCIVGMALWGLPFYYDFMVQQFGWSRGQVTSGNALSKLVVGPLLGFFAGWMVDRFGPRRLMLAGILMGGAAVPWISHTLVQHFGWQAALRTLGLLILVIALPAALLAKEPPHAKKSTVSPGFADARDAFTTIPFFLLTLGSMFSIAAVSG